jgi:PIN domain nuclease of toxin-antitoxin system
MEMKMKKLVFSMMLCFLLAIPIFSVAQQLTDNPETPDKADILKFLDMMHAKAQMTQILEGMARQVRLGAEQGFKHRDPFDRVLIAQSIVEKLPLVTADPKFERYPVEIIW